MSDDDKYEELPDFEMSPDIDFSPGTPGVASAGITAVSEAGSTFINTIGGKTFDDVIENVLPRGFGRALATVEKVTNLIESNKYYAEKTLAAPIKEAKMLVGKHVDKLNGKLPKGIVDTLKEWSAVRPTSYGRSESEMREASIENDLKAVFGAQNAINERNRTEDIVREDIRDRKRDAQYKEAITLHSNAEQYLAKLVNYQDTVAVSFQKKTLEIQLRQYGVMIDTAETLKKSNDLIIQNLINIAHNTSLPEFAKSKNTDKFKDVLRTNIYSAGISKAGKLFTDNDLINRLIELGKVKGKAAVDQTSEAFTDALSMAGMLNDTVEPMLQNMSAEEAAGAAANIGGSMAGDWVTTRAARWAGSAIGKLLKQFDPDNKIGHAGDIIDYIHDNPTAALPALKDLLGKFKDSNGNAYLEQEGWKGDTLRKIVENIDQAQQLALSGGGTRGISKSSNQYFSEQGILSRAAVFSLEEVIPGWLQRIHHNTAIMASGNPDIPIVHYSYEKQRFIGDGDYYKEIRNNLFDESSKNSLVHDGESIIKAIDADGTMSEELKDKILARLLSDNIDNLGKSNQVTLGDYDRITNAETWTSDEIDEESAAQIAELFKNAAGEKYGTKHNSVTKLLSKFGANIADKRNIVQELANAGNRKLLEEIGVIGSYGNFDPDKYMELLHQKEIAFGGDDTFLNSTGIENILSINYAKDREREEQLRENIDRHAEDLAEKEKKKEKKEHTIDHELARVKASKNKDLLDINGPMLPGIDIISGNNASSETIKISKKGAKGIVEAINRGADRTVTKLEDLEKILTQMRDQQQSKLSVGFDNSLKRLWAAGKWTIQKSKDLFTNIVMPGGKKAAGLFGKAFGGIENAFGWVNKKLQTISDIYLEGENDPRMLAFKIKAGHYVCEIKDDEGNVKETRVVKFYTDIKGDIYDTAEGKHDLVLPDNKIEYAFVITPLGKRRITAFGAGHSKIMDWANRHAILGAPIRAAVNLFGHARNLMDKALSFVGGYFDVYLPSQETPVLHAWKIKQRRYFMRLEDGTVKYVTDIKDIIDSKADVYEKMDDGTEEIRLAMADAKNAYYKTALGKQIFLWGSKFKDFIVDKVKPLEKLEWAANKILDFVDEPIDIYVRNNLSPTGVRLRAAEMSAGVYVCTITNTVIRRPSQIKGPVNKIVGDKVSIALSEEDIRIGICDSQGRPIRGIGKILLDKGKKAVEWTIGLAKSAYTKAKEGIGKLLGFFGDTKGVNLGWFKEWLTSDPVVDELKEIKQILDERLPYADGNWPGKRRRRVRSGYIVDENGTERKIGDQDNDGTVDGQEKKGDLGSAKESEAPVTPDGSKPGFFRRMASKFWNKFTGNKAANATAAAGVLAAGGANAAGAPAPGPMSGSTGVPGNPNPGAPAEESLGSKAMQWATGGYFGAKALGWAGRKIMGMGAPKLPGAGGAIGNAIKSGAKLAGQGMWNATKFMFNPTRFGIAARALPFVGRALGMVLGGPVGIALGVGMMAYGAYGLYKEKFGYASKKITKLRLLQYGFTESHQEYVGAVLKLEKLLDKYVKYPKGEAMLDEVDYTADEKEDIREMFSIDEDDERSLGVFSVWFRTRFKPVFLAHLTALKKLNIDQKLYELDLEGKELADYVQMVRGIQVDYLEVQSPFPKGESLNSTNADVDKLADELLASTKIKDSRKILPKGGKDAAAIAAGVNDENDPNKKPEVKELGDLKQDSPYGEKPNTPTPQVPGIHGNANEKKITSSEAIIARKENAKIGALDAVKYRAYGLIDLDGETTSVLDSLEDVIAPFMVSDNVGGSNNRTAVTFNGNLQEIVSKVYGNFGILQDNYAGLSNLSEYLTKRFIPVFANYLLAIKTYTGKLDRNAKSALGQEGEYRAAIACRDSLDSDGQSIWNYTKSPWATNRKLNQDKLSTVANLEYLKSKLPPSSTALAKEERVDEVREKAKIADDKTKGEQYKDPAKEAKEKTEEAPSGFRRIVNSLDDKISAATQWASEKTNSVLDAIGLGGDKAKSAGVSTSSMGIKVGASGPTNAAALKGDELLGTSIAASESGSRKYNAYNRGTSKADSNNKENIDLTKLTVSEVMRRQRLASGHPDRLFAVGKYQITPDPLSSAVRFLRISPDEKFTPELQERIFAEFLATKQKGRGPIEDFIKGKSKNVNAAVDSVATEWAGVSGSNGKGKYDGDGANKATVSTAQITKSLENSRAKYAALVASGVDPAKAYGIAVGAYTDTSMATSASGVIGSSAGPGSSGKIKGAPVAAGAGGGTGGGATPTGGAGAAPGAPTADTSNIDLSSLDPVGGQSLDKLRKIDPTYLHYLALMAKDFEKATGKKLRFTSSFRTNEDQKRLAASGNGFAAAPGSSPHEFGIAIDVDRGFGEQLNKLGLLKKYGFTAPIGQEPWHIENVALSTMPAEAKRMTAAQRKSVITGSLGKGGDGIGLRGGNYAKKSRNIEYQKSLMGQGGGKAPTPPASAGGPAPEAKGVGGGAGAPAAAPLGSTPPIAPAAATPSNASTVKSAVNAATTKIANKAPTNYTPEAANKHVDDLMKASYGFKNNDQSATATNKAKLEKENNQLAVEANNMLLAEAKITNSLLTDIKNILAKKEVMPSSDKSDEVIDKSNSSSKPSVFDRVKRGTASSQLPIDLGSSGIL